MLLQLFNANFCPKLHVRNRCSGKFLNLELFFNYFAFLHVIIMSRASFRVNPHSIVCLNVKKIVARNRYHIWSLSDSNGIRTHNHLVCNWTLNHLAELAKWLSVCSWTKWLWFRIPLLSLCFVFVLNIWEGSWSCEKCQNIKVWRKLEWVTSKSLFL